MQKNEILEFLEQIDAHLSKYFAKQLITKQITNKKFEMRIFGKSALLLAGLSDSVGTNDIDILRVDGQVSTDAASEITKSLEAEFGKRKVMVHGYYLEFVNPAIVFLSQKPRWISISSTYQYLSVKYLDASHVVASKLFSTFSKISKDIGNADRPESGRMMCGGDWNSGLSDAVWCASGGGLGVGIRSPHNGFNLVRQCTH